MLVDIIIVNWNSGPQLQACLESIRHFGAGLVNQTIVVDNGSVDGSGASVAGPPNVALIQTGANLGFGKACNLGASRASSDYVLFLNPDAALYSETLPKVLTFMQNPDHAQVGICGVQLLNEAGSVSRSCARFPSAIGFLAHAIGFDRVFPSMGHVMVEWNHGQTREVDHVIGAFFLVRRAVFDSLRGFDERFFVYLEDLDFSCRARQAGWLSVYLADGKAFHSGGGTSKQIPARRLFYSLRSRLQYAFKHFPLSGACLVLVATLFVEPLTRSGAVLLGLSLSGLRQTWAAYGMLWRSLPQWLFKGVDS